MKLPRVQKGIIDSTIVNIQGEEWLDSVFQRMQKDNPIIATYLLTCRKTNENGALIGLLVYRFLESQLEAEAML